ncbi:hypothetical protein ALC57_18125 [Trachymyrmex cornetzi]|uniref:Uncharacterized protein n=1 Tax=Trachymyrmex cornetzi TaxID=471704 RepID=A0A151ISF4_9HYME|nr:hypothetical protein ALC57_18125 [Trachymyrmex cornetzi]
MSQPTCCWCKRFIPRSRRCTFCGIDNGLPPDGSGRPRSLLLKSSLTALNNKFASFESGLGFVDRLELKLDALSAKMAGLASLSGRQAALEQCYIRLEKAVSTGRVAAAGAAPPDVLTARFEHLMTKQRDHELIIFGLPKMTSGERMEAVLLIVRLVHR